MGGAAKPDRENMFQTQQAPDDNRAVSSRASAGNNEPIPTRLYRKSLASVGGDASGDVVGVALEFALFGNVGGHGH
jgi:hypothetical protein